MSWTKRVLEKKKCMIKSSKENCCPKTITHMITFYFKTSILNIAMATQAVICVEQH